MYLCIDLSQKDTIALSFFTEDFFEQKKYFGRNRELLVSIDTALTEVSLDKKNIQGIMVVVGAGSFTNTRVAVTVANTWGYAQRIPLLAIQEGQKKEVQKLIPILQKQPVGQYISATYSGEPNIGHKKKS